nr:MAG TPA: ChiA1-BD-binding domain protein [Caudoviricetes sp.]
MKLYILTDENGYIISSTRERILKEQIEVELNDESETLKYKYVDGELIELTPEEKEELYPTQKDKKAEQEETLKQMMFASARASFLDELNDTEAAKISLCYDPWKTDTAYKVGDRVLCDGKLWKCRQAHTSQANWKPSINTASLWEVINVENAGTLDDPIPYDQTMTVYNGKYYLEEGIIYKCIRDSGQPLYATCASLVGNYFEVAR